MRKICEQKSNRQKSVKKWSLPSSVLLTCKRSWRITFYGCTFFNYFHRFEISVKFCIFWILTCKKRSKKFLGSLSTYNLELIECKFARNGLTNWNKIVVNIFKNIIWHVFAGESHQVVKITVTYWEVVDFLSYKTQGVDGGYGFFSVVEPEPEPEPEP